MKPLETEGLVWMDGRMVPAEEATVQVVDPNVQAGLGVFETVAVRDGLPLDAPEHIVRLLERSRAAPRPAPPDIVARPPASMQA